MTLLKKRLIISLAAWMLSSPSLFFSALVIVGLVVDLSSGLTWYTGFAALVALFIFISWGLQFEMSRAWVQGRQPSTAMTIASLILLVLTAFIFWESFLLFFAVFILGIFLVVFYWPWKSKKETNAPQ